jgi:peptidoglycan/xylan/chitin deacetylase (PgdA/CDA1 family)
MNKRFKRIKAALAFSLIFMFGSVFVSANVSASSSQLISKVSTSTDVVALTFDDCDSPSNISAVLKILKTNGIKATFFVMGEAAADNPDSIRSISNAGMEIGNHSYSHPDLTTLSSSSIQSQLNKSDNAINNATGKSTKPLFRPPYGSYNNSVLNSAGSIGYTRAIMWNIDTVDWSGASANLIYSRVVNNISPGSIVLMHCNLEAVNTKYALQNIINNLSSRGYSFATVSQLLAGSRGTYSMGSTGTNYALTSSGVILRLGSTNAAVKDLQQALVNKGYNLSVDGQFGPITLNAVMSFQRSQGILVDGEVGPITWGKL